MKLHEIINLDYESNEVPIEKLIPYKRSLYTYYEDYFCCEPVLMVTAVFNAGAIGKIVSSNDFGEALEEYCDGDEDEMETINFNSIMLNDL